MLLQTKTPHRNRLGFILTWMRERTGSLAVPVVFHNISNVAQSFV